MKKQLAIKGHEYRGNEVIEILKMLGGKNNGKWHGNSINMFYFVDEKGFIDGLDTWNDRNIEFDVFTLEKFLEKFPYKVGDKIINDNYSGYGIITTMVWDGDDCCVKYRVEFEDFGVIEWFKYNKIKISDVRGYICDNDQLHELCVSKLSTLMIDSEVCKDEVEIVLNGYEIETRGDKTFAIKKKPKYPITYEECCKVLGSDPSRIMVISNHKDMIHEENKHCSEMYNLYQLLICRDAYWKIAGKQMGLSKSWDPDWEKSDSGYVYCIVNKCNNIGVTCEWLKNNYILSFPTTEMRDAFYESFKDLIEKCKNLL